MTTLNVVSDQHALVVTPTWLIIYKKKMANYYDHLLALRYKFAKKHVLLFYFVTNYIEVKTIYKIMHIFLFPLRNILYKEFMY